jgi:hypothetical protein
VPAGSMNRGDSQPARRPAPARLKGSVMGGQYQLVLNGGVGFTYDVQASTNLTDWTSFTNIQTTNMSMPVMSLDAPQVPQQYFRAVRK